MEIHGGREADATGIGDPLPTANACLSCGACCATYHVAFYYGETDDLTPGGVPAEWTEAAGPFLACMKGTSTFPVRCIALEGNIGVSVHCAIYPRRPSACRVFHVDWDGASMRGDEDSYRRCTLSRAAWGFPPLQGVIIEPVGVPESPLPDPSPGTTPIPRKAA
ncbi:MAG: YkgJ family cysteine cluster protein [Candidatus Eisenbacteria bacterium]|uniref:YkgJ family cysteine cluster protein n=1 Tax=Eiseniibacteriota bacterium TaxID=2212470 RepID=A0A948RVS5_UNCEI|nr:YkgJ family cysteine cluster protein [Candidatus Eisenbacteria bacterium]MBU1949547.1 YkgJ family cysteine cluster protein [Candidatus Eisenbacteria bacterium]MBU2691938.1 YkgJ family cysteine cluster protein [Candidatus Eisenbacteria bacterium]